MTGKQKLLLYMIVFVVAFGISYSIGTDNAQSDLLLIVCIVLFLLALLIYLYWPIYVLTKSTNMQLVERVLEKRKKVPIYPYNAALARGEYQEAERWLKQVRNLPKSKRMMMQTALLLVQADIEQTEELMRAVPANNESGAYLHALHCLKKGDRAGYEQHLQRVKKPTLQQVLQAEASFCAGDLERAHLFGEQAVSFAKGLERYLFLKSLERSEAKGEQRTSYF